MSTRIARARLFQFSYVALCVTLLFYAVPGDREILKYSLFFIIMAMTAVLFVYFRCRKCGKSLFYDPRMPSHIIPSVNLLIPAKDLCPKCGAMRD